jgi:hypothetical protein
MQVAEAGQRDLNSAELRTSSGAFARSITAYPRPEKNFAAVSVRRRS